VGSEIAHWLAVEDDGSVVHGGPDEALVDVALAGGTVTEEADGGLVHRAVVARAHRVPDSALEPLAHRIAGGVEALVADDDRVQVEAGGQRVPATVVGAPEDPEQLGGVDPPGPRHPVLPVGREHHVLGLHGPARADLRRLLPEQGHPDAQLPLPLQRVGLAVEAAHQHHVAVELLQSRAVDVACEVVEAGVGHPLALRGEQLDEVRITLVGGFQCGEDVLAAGALVGYRRNGRGPVVRIGHDASSCSGPATVRGGTGRARPDPGTRVGAPCPA
jgi:hypothetical protein